MTLTLAKIARHTPPTSLVAIDPGETSGWCHFECFRLVQAGQSRTVLLDDIVDLVASRTPQVLVVESFRLYPWAAKQQSWSEFGTKEVIGVLRAFAQRNKLPFVEQSASTAKAFFTNTRLRHLGLYQRGLKHANDAIRHACYYLAFGSSRAT